MAIPQITIKPQGNGPRMYGQKYPSVSEVLNVIEKRYLETWRSKVGSAEADKHSKEATALGTKIHHLAKIVALNQYAYRTTPDLRPYGRAIEGFLESHVARVLQVELSLCSPRRRFGGTLDLYCELNDGSRAIVDWKTSKSLTREYGLQCAGYALLCKDEGMPVNKRLVVQLKKDKPGEIYVREYKDHTADAKAFMALVEVWHWQNRRKMQKLGITLD